MILGAILASALLLGEIPNSMTSERVEASHGGPITCENSDYNCIYVDITDGNNGNRIVCTRAVCGDGMFGGRKYKLESLYAFDGGDIYNHPTSTAPDRALSLRVNGLSFTVSGSSPCSYQGGVYLDSGFSQRWNTVNSPTSISCDYSGGFSNWNFTPGRTYYVRVEFSDRTGSVVGTSSYLMPEVTTSTSSSTSSTLSYAGTTSTSVSSRSDNNPCTDPQNPNFACGWAGVDSSGRVGGVIVCTYSVCGSGSFGGRRYILQTQQEPDGNVAGWGSGFYDQTNNRFYPEGLDGPWFNGGDSWADIRSSLSATRTTTTTTTTTTSVVSTVPDSESTSTVASSVTPTTASGNPNGGTTSTLAPSGGTVPESGVSTTTVAPVEPGSGEVVVGGATIETSVTIETDAGVATVSAGGVTASLSGEQSEQAANVSDENSLVFNAGDEVSLNVSGFQPESEAEAIVYSEPRKLGILQVDAQGNLNATVELPPDLESGNHTLVLSGVDSNGNPISVKFGLIVFGNDGGIPLWMWVLVGLLLAVLFSSVSLNLRQRGTPRPA